MVLLVCCVALCAATPPEIPSTFYSKVSVVVQHGDVQRGPTWIGGGIFAVDKEASIARTDIYIVGKNNDQQPYLFHTLDRYDLQSSFTIDERQSCKKTIIKGKPENPWAWVAKSHFTGISTYLGSELENWEYISPAEITYKISVKKGTAEPVVFSTRHLSNESIVSSWTMTFMEWTAAKPPAWMVYIPQKCLYLEMPNAPALLGDNAGVTYFANKNWNCVDPPCSSTVPAGTGQPNYGCAEFVARSLVYGSYIPNIGALDPQSSYYGWSYNGQTYDLCYTTSLSSALGALGFVSMPAQASSVSAASAVFGDGGDGYFSHAVIGVGPSHIDAHNNARLHLSVTSDLINGIDAVWAPPGNPTSSGSSGTASSTSSYSGVLESGAAAVNEGGNAIYDVQKPDSNKVQINIKTDSQNMKYVRVVELAENSEPNEMQVREEKASRKFYA